MHSGEYQRSFNCCGVIVGISAGIAAASNGCGIGVGVAAGISKDSNGSSSDCTPAFADAAGIGGSCDERDEPANNFEVSTESRKKPGFPEPGWWEFLKGEMSAA